MRYFLESVMSNELFFITNNALLKNGNFNNPEYIEMSIFSTSIYKLLFLINFERHLLYCHNISIIKNIWSTGCFISNDIIDYFERGIFSGKIYFRKN